jgi:hypothetical protein
MTIYYNPETGEIEDYPDVPAPPPINDIPPEVNPTDTSSPNYVPPEEEEPTPITPTPTPTTTIPDSNVPPPPVAFDPITGDPIDIPLPTPEQIAQEENLPPTPTGAFDDGGNLVPFTEYKPEAQPGYVPTVEIYSQKQTQYEQEKISFEDKWQPLIVNDTFQGTEEQFAQYQQDFQAVSAKFVETESYREKLIVEEEKQVAIFETKLKNSNPDLYEVYKTQGVDAYNARVAEIQVQYGKSLIQTAEQERALNQLKATPGVFKDGKFSLIEYLKENPNDIDTVIRAGFDMSPSEIGELNNAIQASKGYWTEEGNLKAYDALVAGVLSQEQIELLTGTRIDTSKPPPLVEFGDIYIKSHPLDIRKEGASKNLSDYEAIVREVGPNLQGIGMWNYPHFYEELRKRYNEIYGAGTAQAATARSVAGESLGAFFGQVPAKVIEPTYGTHTITAGDWVELAIGVASISMPLWLPKVSALAPKLNPYGKIVIELKDGSKATVWEGIKLVDNPIIGKSGNQIKIGTSNMTFPETAKIKMPGIMEGGNFTFEPRTGLETKVLTNVKNLRSMGVTEEGIKQIQETLPRVQSFFGKKSPYLTTDVVTDPIQTLSKEGVETVIKESISEGAKFVKAYGSSTMKPQLNPADIDEWIRLRGKLPGDMDIQLGNVTKESAEEFAQRLTKKLQDIGEDVFIDADNPTLIQTKSGSHAVDIHTQGDIGLSGSSESEFATMSYGMSKSSPAIEVEVPGIGKYKIARLSETGIGKQEQVLGWRFNAETGQIEISPASFRMKDYADLYEIIKTYAGEADARAWAKGIGFDADELAKVASNTPDDFVWEFTPSTGSKLTSPGISTPVITLISPALIAASTSIPIGVTSTGQLITMSPSAPSASVRSSISASFGSELPTFTSVKSISSPVVDEISPTISESSSVKESDAAESPSTTSPGETIVDDDSSAGLFPDEPSTSIGTDKPVEVVSTSPGSTPPSKSIISPTPISISPPSAPPTTVKVFSPPGSSPGTKSPYVSPPSFSPPKSQVSISPPSTSTPSYPPSISPPSVRPPSTSPSVMPPYLKPPVSQPGKPPVIWLSGNMKDRKSPSYDSPISWRQGFVYWTVSPPKDGWNTPGKPAIKCTKQPPYGAFTTSGIGSAYRTIQTLGGNADILLDIDMGAFDVRIESPSKSAGKSGAIRFTRDVNQNTTRALTVKGVHVT